MASPVFQYMPSTTFWEKGKDLVLKSRSKFRQVQSAYPTGRKSCSRYLEPRNKNQEAKVGKAIGIYFPNRHWILSFAAFPIFCA